jgi:hypothetical protein
MSLEQHSPYVFERVREAFLSSVDYASYGLTDVVHLDDFDAELCESFLLHRDLKTKVQLLDLIEEFFEVTIMHDLFRKSDLNSCVCVFFLARSRKMRLLRLSKLNNSART